MSRLDSFTCSDEAYENELLPVGFFPVPGSAATLRTFSVISLSARSTSI